MKIIILYLLLITNVYGEEVASLLSVDDAQALLPSSFFFEKGTGMESYNGISILYVGCETVHGLANIDFQNSEATGLKLNKEGVIFVLSTSPNGFTNSLKAVKSKATVSKELRWKIKGTEYRVLIIGENKETIKLVQDALSKP